VEPSRIRMIAERVVLTQWAKDWQADATYIFHNPTAEPIATVFAFPEGCPFAETNGNVTGFYVDPQLRDLTTLVRGQPVSTRLVEQRPWQGLELCIGRVHAFDIALAPNERVEVRHRYRFSAGTGIGFEEVQYITRTGALWNGPIGSAEFVVSPRGAAHGMSWPEGLRFVGFEERTGRADEPGRIAYRFAARDWTPKQDFVVALHGWPLASSLATEKGIKVPCPDAASVSSGDLAADTTPDPAADELLTPLSDADLALCRNLPYARHGYPFQRPELRAAFDREAEVPGDEDGPSHKRFRLGAANPFYSDTLLDDRDRAYLAAIQREQDRRAATPGVLDALRAELKRTSGHDQVLRVQSLRIRGDWAWIHVLPESRNGRDHYEDLSALMHKADGRWRVAEIPCAEDDDPSSRRARITVSSDA
jgi:hypothetical protein